MRKIAALLLVLIVLPASAWAEEGVKKVLEQAQMDDIYEFAEDYGAKQEVEGIFQSALKGDFKNMDDLAAWAKQQIAEPLKKMFAAGQRMLGPVLLAAVLRAASTKRNSGSDGAAFLLRLSLILLFSELALEAFASAEEYLRATKGFTDVIAPGLTAILAIMGMSSSSAMVSPAAALAGNAAEHLFLDYGMPLCRIALCTAIAGNLSSAVDLGRVTRMLKKTANWGSGLATTLFTALLALQGSVSQPLDGVAVRTVKFAVDSAAPVIGSGVSDAWESYVSGMLIAKNAVGISGIAALLAAALKPLASCGLAMLLLSVVAAILDVLGDKETAKAAEQISGICQMTLSLSTGALAIATVLLGAAMAVGNNLAG